MEIFNLSFKAEDSYASLLAQFVEHVSLKHHLASRESLQLSLAVEELITYVATAVSGQEIQLAMQTYPYGVKINLSFQLESEGFKYFNFVVDGEEIHKSETHLNHLGLLIAAKAVDKYHLQINGDHIEIELLKEHAFSIVQAKTYIPTGKAFSATQNPPFNADMLEEMAAYVLGQYDENYYEAHMLSPGRLFTYHQAEHIDFSMAFDTAGKILGFMYWKKFEKSCYEFFGPYIFGGERLEIATFLSTQMVEKCARSGAYFLYSEKTTADLPTQYFEELATSDAHQSTFYYRQLKEDMGGSIWCHMDLRTEMEDLYEQLLLFRDFSDAESAGAEQNKHSVFSVQPDQIQSRAVIVPYLFGQDAEQNIIRHLEELQKEGYQEIRVQLDLHFKWQAYLGKLFFDRGFKPLFIKPKAGVSDLLIMQYHGA